MILQKKFPKPPELIGDYKENNAQLQAQGEYTRVLAGRIQELAGKEKLSNEEKEVMQGYITELNELIPDLNLAYDETGWKAEPNQ